MKFSVLLPTRNRLDLLRCAVETVLRQDYGDWEIIVSDNCSIDDVEGYVGGLSDARIKYFKTETFVPVTDNWNNALRHSSGDYVIMLGDDDCLLKGYFSRMFELLQHFEKPDFIYTGAYLYAYPGVLPDYPDGLLQSNTYASFLKEGGEAFWLDHKRAREVVQNAMDFKLRYQFNMQHALISRRLVNRLALAGAFFQSPYPDYYAMNMMMLEADRILVYPKPVVLVGISTKSFGFYYFNDKEQMGMAFLNNLSDTERKWRLENPLLPGTDMNSCWLLAMETVQRNCGKELRPRLNYRRYRCLQSLHVLRRYFANMPGSAEALAELRRLLPNLERTAFGVLFAVMASVLLPKPRRALMVDSMLRHMEMYPGFFPNKVVGRYSSAISVFESIGS